MNLEELFSHFEYVSYRRLEGVAVFTKDKESGNVTFEHEHTETLFSDGVIVKAESHKKTYHNPTYCISKNICELSGGKEETIFEVYLADKEKSTIDAASMKLRELTYKVYRSEKHSLVGA